MFDHFHVFLMCFSREHLRRVLRKKTSAELRFIYIFTSSPLHIYILIYISAHLHIFTHLHACSCSHLHISAHLHILASTCHIFTSLLRPGAVPPEHHVKQPSAEIVRIEGAKCRRERVLAVRRNPLRRSCVSRARNAGKIAFWIWRGPDSAEIARVEGAKCRRERVLARSRATLCADRARRGREMQVSAFWICPAQPSAEIVRVEGAKCR